MTRVMVLPRTQGAGFEDAVLRSALSSYQRRKAQRLALAEEERLEKKQKRLIDYQTEIQDRRLLQKTMLENLSMVPTEEDQKPFMTVKFGNNQIPLYAPKKEVDRPYKVGTLQDFKEGDQLVQKIYTEKGWLPTGKTAPRFKETADPTPTTTSFTHLKTGRKIPNVRRGSPEYQGYKSKPDEWVEGTYPSEFQVKTDPKTGAVTVTSRSALASQQKAQQEADEIFKEEELKTANVISLADTVSRLAGQDSTALGIVGGTQKLVDRAFEQVKASSRLMTGGKALINGKIVPEEKLFDINQYDFGLFAKGASQAARLKASGLKLAYILARQNDPFGRLSDHEVQMALGMIGLKTGSVTQLRSALDQVKRDAVMQFENFYQQQKNEELPQNYFQTKYPTTIMGVKKDPSNMSNAELVEALNEAMRNANTPDNTGATQ